MKIWTYYITIAFSIFFHQIIWVSAADAANRIMPLGDSITEGNGNFDEASYRRRLYKWLTGELLLTGVGYNPDFVGSLVNGIPNDFDKDNEGHPGWTDDEILNGRPPEEGQLSDWLDAHQPQIVLLHIGTNDVDPSPDDVEAILDGIDEFSPNVWVVLARIINRNCITDDPSCPESVTTMNFNTNVANMAQARILAGDKIIIVDMENGDVGVAVIDYHLSTDIPPGDMVDNLHPSETGYAKMADLWFDSLMQILPQADAGPDQNVNEFETVTLDGSGSTDPKIGTLSYQWVQTPGTPVVDLLPDDQAEQPTFEAPDAGLTGITLTFTLTVTDEDELVSTDTVDIVVVENIVQANAGPDQTVDESATVTLDASNSVGVGLTYQWTQTAGTPIVTLSDDTAMQPTFAAPDVGSDGETLTFRLTITDANNLEDTDTVNINVHNPNSSDGGGGGGCFITTSGYGSSMAPGGNTSLVAPPGISAATLELVIAMIAFISICAAIVQYRRRKRWIKPLYS